MRRKWYCLTVPKWYDNNQTVPSKAWFTQYGFEKWHPKMLETIRSFLERYPYFEIRILTCTKPDNIVMHGKTQCISANYNFQPKIHRQAYGFSPQIYNYVGYEYKTAFIYPNELGQKIIDAINKKVSAIA